MKLERVEIENYRAIEKLDLPLDPELTVFHGANGYGKTSVLSAIATGLGSIPMLLPEVSGVGFRKTDRRGQRPMRVMLRTCDGIEWDRRLLWEQNKTKRWMLKDAMEEIVVADREGTKPRTLPIVAFYDTERAVLDAPPQHQNFKTEFPRYAALEGALTPRANFKEFFKWFYVMENKELREKKERRDLEYRLKDLDAVREAIERMAPGVSDPRVKSPSLRFVVSLESEAGKPKELEIDQLSGGCRIVLALAADLARRMAQGNPHLKDPLGSEAVVLIDEVDLHLHPEWQQRILKDLTRTFPNTQFIVSTHSPQVLTTVQPHHIVELYRDDDGHITAGSPASATYGAEAGDVLSAVMGVSERPHNDFKTALDQYRRLVSDGDGESSKARDLRAKLESMSPRDPALDRADIEIRKQKLFKRMAESE